jgi:hypothetical protein
MQDDVLKIGAVSATKKEWNDAFLEEFKVWLKWIERLTIWMLLGLSFNAGYFQKNIELGALYSLLAICIGISTKVYALEKLITTQEKVQPNDLGHRE